MPRIRCHYDDCIYLEGKFCGADSVEIDPELGCLTFSQEASHELLDEDEWEEELFEEDEEEWDELDEEVDEDEPGDDEEEW